MKHYFQTILAYLDGAGENSALATATIIDSSGSAPRTAGARMLIFPDGSLAWTIGGGRYEAEARALALEALEALQSGAELPGQSGPWEDAGPEEQDELKLPALALPVSLRGSTDMDMICGGNVVILLELIRRTPKTLAFFRKAAILEEQGQAIRLSARLFFPPEALSCPGPGKGSVVFRGAALRRLPGQAAGHALGQALGQAAGQMAGQAPGRESARILEQDGRILLEEFFPARQHLHIFGAGHVSQALAQLAARTGFHCSVLDDRAEFASAERFPEAKALALPTLEEDECLRYLKKQRPGAGHGIIILTRGHSHDREVLAAALTAQREFSTGYIGMIGSKSKRGAVYAQLRQEGFKDAELDAVHSPIGLPLGAQTPEEIAVSILAELILWRHGRLGPASK